MLKPELFKIVGLPYYDYDQIKKMLFPGEILTLVPEPDNQYDKNAIEVYYSNYKVGYVEKDFTLKLQGVFNVMIDCVSENLILCTTQNPYTM